MSEVQQLEEEKKKQSAGVMSMSKTGGGSNNPFGGADNCSYLQTQVIAKGPTARLSHPLKVFLSLQMTQRGKEIASMQHTKAHSYLVHAPCK